MTNNASSASLGVEQIPAIAASAPCGPQTGKRWPANRRTSSSTHNSGHHRDAGRIFDPDLPRIAKADPMPGTKRLRNDQVERLAQGIGAFVAEQLDCNGVHS